MDGEDDDDGIGNPANYYQHGKDDVEDKLGYEANGSSPSALEYKMNGGRSFAQAVSDAIYGMANPFPIRAGEWQSTGMAPQITSPPKRTPKKKSVLRFTGFAPVVMNPPPTLDDAIDVDPDFFKGATQDCAGPGPHFLTMSFIKDKSKIQEQLLKALSNHVFYFGAECAWRTGTLHPEEGKAAPPFFSHIKRFPHNRDDGLELHVSPEFLVASTRYQE
jgi:hypothetical protein